MTIKSFGNSKCFAYSVLAAFVAFAIPAGLAAKGPDAAAESGTLAGFIFAKDVKTPVAGAVVKIRNINDMKEMASSPTDDNGMFTIAGVPEGRYLLGVSAAKEDFNFDYSVLIKAGELGKLSLSLGTEGGQTTVQATAKKKGFFNTFAGRALVVSAVGVGLYFLIAEPESSPIR